MSHYPIGILDSGSGGLSVWKEIISLLPREGTMYIGDHRCMPYSNKTTGYIRNRAYKLIEFLISQKAKIIVIACNTATVAGIDEYRKKFPMVPIVGVVPVVKTAVTLSKKRNIAVFSTAYTAKSRYQKKLISTFASDVSVKSIGSTKLVTLIEDEKPDEKATEQELYKKLHRIRSRGVDVLVLGCTHFPFLRDKIRAIVGEDVTILDSGAAVARQVKRILDHESKTAEGNNPHYLFFTTGKPDRFAAVASRLLGKNISVNYADI